MKKYIAILLLVVGYAYAETPIKQGPNPCAPLESLCKNNYYTTDDMGASSGKNLYKDCMLLIVSGFPPSRVNTSSLDPKDIEGCKDRIKNFHDKY